MSGFFKGAKIDPRFEKKVNKELNAVLLPSIVLTHPIKSFDKINKDALSGWVAVKVEEYLGIEDEVLSGIIVNTMEEDKAGQPKKLQHTLEPFLASRAREFMEELWEMMVEAEGADGGIPSSWSDELKAKVFPELQQKVGFDARRERVRSPERVVGRFIDRRDEHREERRNVGRDDRHDERKRYYDRSPRRERSRSRERRGRSRSRTREEPVQRVSSADTYQSSPSVREKSIERPLSPEHGRRKEHHASPERRRERSVSRERRHRHHSRHDGERRHGKKHHHRKRHCSRRPKSVSPGPQMSDLEKMLRQKALESIKNRNTSAILE